MGFGIVCIDFDMVCDAIDVYVDDVVNVMTRFPVKAAIPDNWAYLCYNLEVKGVDIVVVCGIIIKPTIKHTHKKSNGEYIYIYDG